MAQRMRSDNKTITSIRMRNYIYDKMEEVRYIKGLSRTEFIEIAAINLLSKFSEDESRRLKNEI